MSNISKTNTLEKVYTPKVITNILLSHLKEIYHDDITQFLEPSAGNGAMIDVIKENYPNIKIESYDIKPERDDIIEMDFLQSKLEYKKGCIAIMNPPFTKGTKFIDKALERAELVITILSSNTLFSIDYSKYDAKKITYMKAASFLDGKKYNIAIISLMKKNRI